MSELPRQNQPFSITFDNGQESRAIRVVPDAYADIVMRLLGFEEAQPVIFISGGASNMSEEDRKRTEEIIQGVAEFAEEHQTVIIDGGTEAGIMKMVGDTRGLRHYTFPLIGISPLGKVSYPGYDNPHSEADLEDSHSHFVLVDADEWGDETKMIVNMTQAICGHGQKPSVGILINGGKIAMQEVYLATAKQKDKKLPMIILEGSGRAADEISTAFRTGQTNQKILQAILAGGDIQLVGTIEGPGVMKAKLNQKFGFPFKKDGGD